PTGPATTNLHQIHHDRDFASVVELFNIPLRDPAAVTRNQRNSRRPPESPVGVPAGPFPALDQRGQLEVGGPFTFGAAVLIQSEDSDENGTLALGEDSNGNGALDPGEDGTNGNPMDGVLQFGEDVNGNTVLDVPGTANHAAPNHFHRLLSLVEVPTRSHRQLGDPLKLTRVPGKLNLNGINDPRILAALLDERALMNAPERDLNGNGIFDAAEDLNGNGIFDYGLTDAGQPTDELYGAGPLGIGRDWWFNFLVSRDGIDPTSNLPLPMSAGIPSPRPPRPFRDMGLLRSSQSTTPLSSPVEDTVLRRLPNSISGRRLFELGSENPSPPGADEFLDGTVAPTLRHRLLSKVANNTSTRSNCFLVFVTIGMFECKELPNGATRVGAPMDVDNDGQPDTHRAVFIIDRSIAEEAYDKGSKSFDWKKLVLAKQRVN
ncbi:MAG: hypothetical protein DWI21_12585, partial [Planctomycetota bacterium]